MITNKATFLAQCQLRIDALTTSSTVADVLDVTAFTQHEALDFTNLISVATNKLSSVNSSTSATDMLALKGIINSLNPLSKKNVQRGKATDTTVILSPVNMDTAEVTLLTSIGLYKAGSGSTSVVTKHVSLELTSPTTLVVQGTASWEVSDV